MKKIAILFLLCVAVLFSCNQGNEYVADSGDYTLRCRMGEREYMLTVSVNEDDSCRLSFPQESSLADWYYMRAADGSIKYFSSLSSEGELLSRYSGSTAERIFDFVLLVTREGKEITGVSRDRISGKRVSDASTVYTDSESGAPRRLDWQDMTLDIISRP